jgi:hypothetical protein
MNRIKDIRENYDLITEREEADVKKLTSLVRAGLFDAKKLPMLKRALEKNPDEMTVAERKVLLSLLDTLMSEVLHSQQVYSNVKRNVSHKDAMNEENLDEAPKDFLSKFDPKFGTRQPTEQDLPTVLILKRKGIRVYPDHQKVGLYYSQAIDRYFSIPFGNASASITEDTITLSEKKASSNISPTSAEYYRRQLEKQRKKALGKVAEYSNKPAVELTKGQQNLAIKQGYKDALGSANFEKLAAVGGYHLGTGIRRLFGGKHKAENEPENNQPQATKAVEPEATKEPKKTVAPPEKVIPTKKFRKPKKAVAGTGEQPTGDFKFAEPFAKTKTASYSSAVAPARELSPLEKSSGNIDAKKQMPRKRYGFDTKVPGTGPQPEVGKAKLKATFQKKLSESRELNEENLGPKALRKIAAPAAILDTATRAYSGEDPVATGISAGVAATTIPKIAKYIPKAGLLGTLGSAALVAKDLNKSYDIPATREKMRDTKAITSKTMTGVISGEPSLADINAPKVEYIKKNDKELDEQSALRQPSKIIALKPSRIITPPKLKIQPDDTSLWGDEIMAKPAPVKAPPDVSPPPNVPAPRRVRPNKPRPGRNPAREPLVKPAEPTKTPSEPVKTPGTTPGQPKIPSETPKDLPKIEPKIEPIKPPKAPDIDIPDTTPGQPKQPSAPTRPADPATTPASVPAPATLPVTVPAALPVTAPVAKPVASPKTDLDIVPAPAPVKDTGANVKNRNAQKNAGGNKGGKGTTPRIPRVPFLGAPSDSSPKKFSEPLGFKLQAKVTRAGEFDPLDTRKERERQTFAKSLKEDESDRKLSSFKKVSKPLEFRSDKLVKTSGPKQRDVRDARSERERQAYNSSSNVVSELNNIKLNNLKEDYINISGNQILINNTMANKILQVYESLTDSNKIKMNKMLNETTESFKKILNFAVRQ